MFWKLMCKLRPRVLALLSKLPLGCEWVDRPLGRLSSLPQASPCFPQWSRKEMEVQETFLVQWTGRP